ncbi:hypothetical protein CTheo_7303 [Ceratobasidium theobromae]|uniref:Uncharacterized protein n=1 Tax=Ceratobasidium theobromae TaxID=1582974 RepID=A0A5N5QBU8_9AGAM|nr:hypothetical protein CTheo_7303 [Ceratobasidium theobromae]
MSFSPKCATHLNSALHSTSDLLQAPIAPFVAPAPAVPIVPTAPKAPMAPNAILVPLANNQGTNIPNSSEDEATDRIHPAYRRRQSGANTYTMAELNMLVDTVAEVLPCSPQEWEELAQMVKPTGTGGVDPLCRQALEVDKLVQDCVEAAELDDPLPLPDPLEQKSSANTGAPAQSCPTKACTMPPIAPNNVIVIHDTSSKVDAGSDIVISHARAPLLVPAGPCPKQKASYELSLHVCKTPVAPVLTKSTGSQAQKSVAATSTLNVYENMLGKYLDPDTKQKAQAQWHKDNLAEIQLNSKEWTIENLHIKNNKEHELDNLRRSIAGVHHPPIPAPQFPAAPAAQLPAVPGAQLLILLVAQLSAPVITQLLANLVAQLPSVLPAQPAVVPTANSDGQAALQVAPVALSTIPAVPTPNHMTVATDDNPIPSPKTSPLVKCNDASGSGLSYEEKN